MQIHLALLLSSAALPVQADSVPTALVRADSVVVVAVARPTVNVVDTPRVARRPTVIEYSDWYGRRLTIHKWASYATLPLFAFQYVAGKQLYDKSTDAPSWAKNGHGIAATGIAVLFTVNTVTGVWNLWDARKDPEGRKSRTAHALLMLAADAGFTATGILAEKAERSADNRRLHRNIAISSMAVATVSYLMMLPPFRRDWVLTVLAYLVHLAEPWAAVYGNAPALQAATTFAHLAGFLLGGGFAIAADAATIRAARGTEPRRRRQLTYIHGIHRLVLAGLAVTLVSGLLMLAADLESLAASPIFWVKITLVILLLANGGVIARTESLLRAGTDEADRQWGRMRRAAICSFALWFAAVLAGTLLVNVGQ
jgi:uncharacterized membrane protein